MNNIVIGYRERSIPVNTKFWYMNLEHEEDQVVTLTNNRACDYSFNADLVHWENLGVGGKYKSHTMRMALRNSLFYGGTTFL